MLTTVVAFLALVLALAALVLAAVVMRQSAETTTDLRTHRRAHAEAFGHPDPRLDRRQVNLGPPRTAGERRGSHRYEPPADRLAPRPSAIVHTDEPPTDERMQVNIGGALVDVPTNTARVIDGYSGATLWENPTPQPDDEPATSELQQPDLPTTAIRAQRPAPGPTT